MSINVKNISLVKSTAKEKKFCKAWPSGKIGLKALQDIIKNPVIKILIGTIMSAGDSIALTKGCAGVVIETE